MKVFEIIKECRKQAKAAGLTFKRSNMTINNRPAYHFQDRLTGRVVLENCTLGSAYDNVCSGFISSYDVDKSIFIGINQCE